MLIDSDVPVGSGLSSSAALEVASGFALLDGAGQAIDLTRLALCCQRAENEFVGMRCGVMDQFASCRGAADRVLLLDCRSLEFRLSPVDPSVRLVICNSMVHHELAGSEYNRRREQCEEGVARLKTVLPGVRALRDVTIGDLARHGAAVVAAGFAPLPPRRHRERSRPARRGGARGRPGRRSRPTDERVARQHARRL